MRILLVNDYATPTGGAELLTLALRDGLRRRGHEARLFASSARPGPVDSLADYACFGTTSRFRTVLQTANPWAYWRLRGALAEFQPDIVHVRLFLTQLSPLILPLLQDMPSLLHVVWYRPVCPIGTKMLPDGSSCRVRYGQACYRNSCLPLRDWPLLMLQMKLWRQHRSAFKRIVANSEAVRRNLISDGLGPVEVILNCVPPESLRPPLSAPPTVAFAGRLVWEKGVNVLLRAFARAKAKIPDAQLLLAGDGEEREAVGRLVADLHLSGSVSLAGHIPRQEVARYLAPAWVQVVPSRWAEPFGLVAAEALMRGTAVIASASGGLAEIVEDGETGFLVPPGDAEALAEALEVLLADRDLAEQMGRCGREVALARFSEEEFLDRFLELYHELQPGGCADAP